MSEDGNVSKAGSRSVSEHACKGFEHPELATCLHGLGCPVRARPSPCTRPLHTRTNPARLIGLIGAERGIDTLIWQLIASVAAPGFTIHTLVAFATSVLRTVEVGVGRGAGMGRRRF